MNYSIGRRPVMERLESQGTIHRLYIEKGEKKGSIIKLIAMAKDRGIPILTVPKAKLDALVPGENHQGVVAEIGEYQYWELEELLEKVAHISPARLLLLDGIEDPHNLGAIIRTAECAGWQGIIIPKRRSASVTDTVIKTSAGATEFLPIVRVTNLTDTIIRLKKENFWIYGADMDGEDLYRSDITGNLAVVIGGEGKGLSPKIAKHCDGILSIPMRGRINSLNASNAAAIMIYEAIRQEQYRG